MNIPKELKYSQDHEWVKIEGNKATIGITDFAQSQLGDVVFVELPVVGTEVSIGSSFSVIESVKAVSDVYAPLSGKVIAINEILADAPENVNQDACGAGWIATLEISDESQLGELLDSDAYEKLLAEGGH
ncbi:Glycine cleavage system H protein [Sporomusa ovata DSM 2662]|uniref:Glycine cleavage system H protein n=1 Tax=Sporomusa ovata TaxID=2378 RepID=A0A0U1KXX5_9FIRM|nr:glycine cleavage system protein GcvH [Sporomusa ovata]EQB28858.1 glycine cleavage system H protein [Sporomusa ovata DSM 2662]CQR72281.1 Glycine cleavage system H protein [Sporomusa ovata]